MAMPPPEADDPRRSLEMAGGALMDLGCYGVHVMRMLGHRSISAALISRQATHPGRGRLV